MTVNTISAGDGEHFPKQGDTLKMHYVGRLKDGTQFDSSRDKGKLFQFVIGIGQVIKGWDEGVMKLSLGEKATLICSADYGYGEEGVSDVIPPNAELHFEVELLGINDLVVVGSSTSSQSQSSLLCCSVM